MRPWSPAEVADSAGLNTHRCWETTSPSPTGGSRSSVQTVHDQDALYIGSTVPALPCGGPGPAPLALWAGPQAPCRPRQMGSVWAASMHKQGEPRACVHDPHLVPTQSLCAAQPPIIPVHPPRSTACQPSATSSCPARSSASTASGRCGTHTDTPPSATKCPRPSLELGPPEGLWRPAQDVLSALWMYGTLP